ncbi:MAG: hypothetical protein RIS41_1300 [Actinomycetota bacterium]
MGGVVVTTAQGHLVVEVGSAPVLPILDVVHLTLVKGDSLRPLGGNSRPCASRGELRLVDSIRPDAPIIRPVESFREAGRPAIVAEPNSHVSRTCLSRWAGVSSRDDCVAPLRDRCPTRTSAPCCREARARRPPASLHHDLSWWDRREHVDGRWVRCRARPRRGCRHRSGTSARHDARGRP